MRQSRLSALPQLWCKVRGRVSGAGAVVFQRLAALASLRTPGRRGAAPYKARDGRVRNFSALRRWRPCGRRGVEAPPPTGRVTDVGAA